MVKTKTNRSASIDIELSELADEEAKKIDRNFSYIVNESLKVKLK